MSLIHNFLFRTSVLLAVFSLFYSARGSHLLVCLTQHRNSVIANLDLDAWLHLVFDMKANRTETLHLIF